MTHQPETLAITRRTARMGRPPIPHEHGAWVMLYLPLIAGFAVSGAAAAWKWAAMLLAVTGLFLAREAAGLLIRKRGKDGTRFWLCVYVLAALGGIAPLLLSPSGGALLAVGGLAALLFGVHSAMLVVPARKRLDRSVWGEILGAAGLALTGPAAWAASRGALDAGAWTVWLLCVVYFSGAVFYVKMWLEAVRFKAAWNEDLRIWVGGDSLQFHGALATALLFAAGYFGHESTFLLLVGFGPALLRAFYGWMRLSPVLPNLRRVGICESLLAVWFGVFMVWALVR